MNMVLQRPEPFKSRWAEKAMEGTCIDIPDTGADHQNGRADIETGFPKQTMMSVTKGGVPPWGSDHNGILNKITGAVQWMEAGGLPCFNQDFSNKNGGYPAGTLLQGSDPNRPWVLWQCVQDSNGFDPNGNRIDSSAFQNGWVRYPVIADLAGRVLYYDAEGKICIDNDLFVTKQDLDTERNERINADNNLQNNINISYNDLNGKIDNERNERINADNNFIPKWGGEITGTINRQGGGALPEVLMNQGGRVVIQTFQVVGNVHAFDIMINFPVAFSVPPTGLFFTVNRESTGDGSGTPDTRFVCIANTARNTHDPGVTNSYVRVSIILDGKGMTVRPYTVWVMAIGVMN